MKRNKGTGRVAPADDDLRECPGCGLSVRCAFKKTVNPEFKQSPEQLRQIDEVVREILHTGIPYELERLEIMIVILSHISCIEDNRMRFAIWRLREDLIHIAAIYRSE